MPTIFNIIYEYIYMYNRKKINTFIEFIEKTIFLNY